MCVIHLMYMINYMCNIFKALIQLLKVIEIIDIIKKKFKILKKN